MARPATILYVVDESGCWLWQGTLSWNGYGRIKRNNRLQWAHRWFFEEINGPVPVGLMLDHLCKVRRCVNPAHLEVVTNAENQRRGNAARLNWDDVKYIRANYIPRDSEFGQRALARRFGVTHDTVRHIINNESWIDEDVAVEQYPFVAIGE